MVYALYLPSKMWQGRGPMSGLRRLPGAFLLVVPFLFGASSAADEGETSLQTAVIEAQARRIGESLAEGPGAVLLAAIGADRFPIPCGTPVVAAMQRSGSTGAPELRQAQAVLSTRPIPPSARTFATRDGHFIIHYSESAGHSGLMAVDRDGSGLPDFVDRLAEALAASRSFLVERLGYPPPVPAGSRLDVVLIDLGRGLAGYTAHEPASTVAAPQSGGAPATFVVLDDGLEADQVLATALHQVAHAALAAIAPRAPAWWSEASASYLVVAGTGDLKTHEAGLRARLQSPGRGLASEDLLLMQGALLWPMFLAERTGDAAIVRQIWLESAATAGDPATAGESALRRWAGLSVAEAFREFTAWNLFTAERDDGRHYSLGRGFPEPLLPNLGEGLPVSLGPIESVDALGSVAFRLAGNGRRGALDLEVRGEGGAPAADLLVFFRSEGSPVLVPVPLDPGGAGRASIPWGDVREAWIVLRNAALPGGGVSRFDLRGAHDPYAPFDLAALDARSLASSISLEWTTASEKGLVGWNVYRADTPSGPFARLNAVALPAIGEGTTEAGYIFIDERVAPGRRYYYQIEGLTGFGLVERSQTVSGRITAQR
jgi:hypothetical protein